MNESMGSIIARRRRELGMTQEQLAALLSISYQAVSKWENGLSSPDISVLPTLADILGLTLYELFGLAPLPAAGEEELPAPSTLTIADPAEKRNDIVSPDPAPADGDGALPWPDDGTLRAALFVGRRHVGSEAVGSGLFSRTNISFQYEGPALNVQSEFDVTIDGAVAGSVTAGGDVNCGSAGGDLYAGSDVNCDSVNGSVHAGGDVNCDAVSGDVQAGGDVNCDSVVGGVRAGGDVDCGSVGGSVFAEGDVDCGSVGGVVRADGGERDGE